VLSLLIFKLNWNYEMRKKNKFVVGGFNGKGKEVSLGKKRFGR